MARGTRRFALTSMGLALPVTLLMASLSSGTTPNQVDAALDANGNAIATAGYTGVVTAGGSDQDSSVGEIMQVVGKQPKRQNRRPLGWLSSFGGASPAAEPSTAHAEHDHGHQAQSSAPATRANRSRGLLDGLFGISRSRNASVNPTPSGSESIPEPADWNGIPFHQVGSQNTRSNAPATAQPIRDPSEITLAPRRAQVVTRQRIGPPPVPRVETQLVRGRPARTIPVPTAPALRTAPRPANVLSGSSSSRRRSTGTASRVARTDLPSATTSRRKQIRSDESIDDLVPRVSRRALAGSQSTSTGSSTASSRRPKSQVDKTEAVTADAEQIVASDGASLPREMTQAPQAEPTRVAELAIPRQSAPVTPAPATAALMLPPPTDLPAAAASNALATIGQHPTTSGGAAIALPTAVAPSMPNLQHPNAATRPAPQPGFTLPTTVANGPSTIQQGSVAGFRTPTLPSPTLASPTLASPGNLSQPDIKAFAESNSLESNSLAPRSIPSGLTPELPAASRAMNSIGQVSPSIDGESITNDTFNSSNRLDPTSVNNSMRSLEGSDDYGARTLQPGQAAIASELPAIRVVTHGPSEMLIRQTQQFEVRVENRGSIDANGLLVRIQIPDWADVQGHNSSLGQILSNADGRDEQLTWKIDRLPAGTKEQLFIRLTATKSGTYDLAVNWTVVPQQSVAKIHVRQPQLSLTIEGPDQVVYGESATYHVRVLNPGDGVAPNVVFTLSPNSATPQSQKIGDIPAGKEAQFEVELTAQDLGDLRIHGLASGDLELRAESNKVIAVAAAKLEAEMSGPEMKYQNAEASYHLELQNNGTAVSEKVVAIIRLPVGVEYLGGLEGASFSDGQLRWTIDALSPDEARQYDFRCRMIATGEQMLAFECRGTAAGETSVTLATAVEAIADLVLSVNDPAAPASTGQDVIYEIVLRNRGSQAARNVSVVAQFSHGIEPQRVSGQTGEILTGQVLFDPIDQIAPGQEVRLEVVAQADQQGHHRFRTEVRSGDIVLLAEEATHFMNPRSERISRRSSDNENR